MVSLKNRKFSTADELCGFVNENPYVQVVSINIITAVYQEPKYVLFYKEEEEG